MSYLQHYGVLGMKWGVRRYQNKDGTLTAAGQKRYRNKVFKNNYREFDYSHNRQNSPKIAREIYDYVKSTKEYKEAVRKLSITEKLDVDDKTYGRNVNVGMLKAAYDIVNTYGTEIAPSERKYAAYEIMKNLVSIKTPYSSVHGYSLLQDVYNVTLKNASEDIQKKLFGNSAINRNLSEAIKDGLDRDAQNLYYDRKIKASRVPFMTSPHYKEYLKERDSFYTKQNGANADPSYLDEAATADWDTYKQWLASKKYDVPKN